MTIQTQTMKIGLKKLVFLKYFHFTKKLPDRFLSFFLNFRGLSDLSFPFQFFRCSECTRNEPIFIQSAKMTNFQGLISYPLGISDALYLEHNWRKNEKKSIIDVPNGFINNLPINDKNKLLSFYRI